MIHITGQTSQSQDEFCSGEKFQFSELFEEFFFPNSVLLCSFLGAVEWIHKFLYHEFFLGDVERICRSSTAIFIQPNFLTNIRRALFERETWKEKPPRLKYSKIPRIWAHSSGSGAPKLPHTTRATAAPSLWEIFVEGILVIVQKITQYFI